MTLATLKSSEARHLRVLRAERRSPARRQRAARSSTACSAAACMATNPTTPPSRRTNWMPSIGRSTRCAPSRARAEIITAEDRCKIECLGLTGTADAWLPELGMSADLKTGQLRNYREQMAAYALGFMDATFRTEWTSHLLFCDQRQLVTHRFTYDEAKALVSERHRAIPRLREAADRSANTARGARRRRPARRVLQLAAEALAPRRARVQLRGRPRGQREARRVPHRLLGPRRFPRACGGSREEAPHRWRQDPWLDALAAAKARSSSITTPSVATSTASASAPCSALTETSAARSSASCGPRRCRATRPSPKTSSSAEPAP